MTITQFRTRATYLYLGLLLNVVMYKFVVSMRFDISRFGFYYEHSSMNYPQYLIELGIAFFFLVTVRRMRSTLIDILSAFHIMLIGLITILLSLFMFFGPLISVLCTALSTIGALIVRVVLEPFAASNIKVVEILIVILMGIYQIAVGAVLIRFGVAGIKAIGQETAGNNRPS